MSGARRGKIWRRLTLALALTALLPTLGAVWLADKAIRTSAERFFKPELGESLDRSLGLYQELARAVKARMRAEASELAQDAALRRATEADDPSQVGQRLGQLFARYPDLVSLEVRSARGEVLGRATRPRPLDETRENALEVERPLSSPVDGDDESGPRLIAMFAADRARFDELEAASQFVKDYRTLEERRPLDEASYLEAFATLLGLTIAAALGLGVVLARGVATRVTTLSLAAQRVAKGDLEVRVPEAGSDEVTELARSFNRMLSEVAESRSRIEYLQRIGAWQEMARRLAHEIKNPLTPIQLAVQEAHRRCPPGHPEYERLLDTTLEVVEDEVATLRRLVGEFSDFARLPRAVLEPGDLRSLLQELERQLRVGEGDDAEDLPLVQREQLTRLSPVSFVLPPEPARALLDRQMVRRVVLNLVLNAQQALRDAGRPGRVEVRLTREGSWWRLSVEDDGPGIAPEIQATLFDPYVTTKTDGTGLGLAIVKKIIVEHAGQLEAATSRLGGAALVVRLPVAD